MKTTILAATFAALAPLSTLAAGIMAMEPFAFATAPTAKAGGAYVSLMNHGPADRLIDAKGDIAKRIEIHEHLKDGDVMRMRQVEGGLELPEGGMIEMGPGGYHVMLMGLKGPLVEGEKFPLTLIFESGTEMAVEVSVKARGEHGMKHGHSSD